jgi:hypothetical protein
MDEWLDMEDCRKAEEIINRVGCRNAFTEIVVSLGAKAAAMCVDVYRELCKKTTSATSEAGSGLPQTRKAAGKGIVIDLDETASLDRSDISFTPTPADILFLCALFEYDANEIAEEMHRMIDELMRRNNIDIVEKLFIPSDIRSVISEIEKIYRSRILDTVKKCKHYSSLF